MPKRQPRLGRKPARNNEQSVKRTRLFCADLHHVLVHICSDILPITPMLHLKKLFEAVPQFMRRIHDVAPFYRKVTLSSWKGHTVNDCKMYLWNLARYFALLPDHRWRKRVLQCNGTLGAEGLETYLGQYSCRFLRLKMCIYLHGGGSWFVVFNASWILRFREIFALLVFACWS